MNKKRTLLTVVAMILVCVLSVMGTLAYLKTTSNTVTNTFVAAGGPGPFVDKDKEGKEKFQLLEYEVDVTSAGKYFLKNSAEEGETPVYTEVQENRYDKVLPGTTLPKQAFVKLSRTGKLDDGTTVTPAPAYLYLEVTNNLKTGEYKWSVDADNWEKLGTVGSNDLYLYIGSFADTNHVLTTVAADSRIDIITDDKVVAEDVNLTAGEFTLVFNAYLAQASTGETDDPAAVFTACFNKTITPVTGTEDGE